MISNASLLTIRYLYDPCYDRIDELVDCYDVEHLSTN